MLNGKCSDSIMKGVFLDFDAVVEGDFVLISKGDVL